MLMGFFYVKQLNFVKNLHKNAWLLLLPIVLGLRHFMIMDDMMEEINLLG